MPAATEDPRRFRRRVRADNVLHLHLSHLHMVRATLSINVPTFGTVAQNHQVRHADSAVRAPSP
jgi:hypothetical protein